ncbi:MAG: cation acetate symporter [Caldibacillus debilis]|jgi:cation/acetate symporter|uniref:Cation acetate symporter n=1 Tax=Caldibacillus debilis TaxID=301148 RepID=A0A3E0K2J3_9BACI|nr:sodium/solute symporter [Caldibacillus debilis]MBO2482909.1 cation acetate symporter [Bacillaceae bacterium]MBY6271276.1 cation acetate symporter [Bacillaceae bacterium]OUM86711.1 MAG: cation acetate symporter [Caldibacillus debilis]REJ27415.1 MAG: cation acetate symporter [Caldibacillus debilis]
MNPIVVVLFLAIVILTLIVTYIAAKRTKSAGDFYTAGGGLTGWQNGLAIAGDYLSAASFLGIAGMIALQGFDGFFYSIGFLIAYLVVLFLVAEPLRNLGKYTLADMINSRFDARKVRGVAAISTITIVLFYMIAQMVGAGALIQLLFDIPYWVAVLIVGVMMTIYVLFGGMFATSWVQIIKAVLLMAGMIIVSFIVLLKFHFNIGAMFTEVKTATSHGADYLNPGIKYKDPLGTLSLMLALVLGTSGLPHILMRFFTVKDARTARRSVITATWTIGIFYILTLFLGFGAAIFVGESKILEANPGGNMAAPLLAEAIGGNLLFAFISAVAFATILAVVAGLVLSGASAFAHDIYGQIIKKGNISDRQQMLAARYAALGVSVLSILISLGAQYLNVAFLVSLAFCIAASANLPVILYTVYWKRFNTSGAVWASLSGLISALVLVSISPSVFSPVEGAALFVGEPIFPLDNPALVSVPLGFLGGFLGTIFSKEQDLRRYAEVSVRAHTGYRGTKSAGP